MVRALIPAVAPGSTMEDIVLAPFDYALLDTPASSVRLRIGCTVAWARDTADGEVDVGLVHNADGRRVRVRAKHSTLACFNMSIPYLLDGLSPEQSTALAGNVKAPLIYTNVALRQWRPWVALGVHEIFGVDTFHSRVKLDYPVALGGYRCAVDPSEPVLVHMVHVPLVPAASDPRAALRAARKTLFGLKIEDYERHIREDLTRMLGPGGFDAERDIAAITVNRWSHGYSYGPNTLMEPENVGQRSMERARAPLGLALTRFRGHLPSLSRHDEGVYEEVVHVGPSAPVVYSRVQGRGGPYRPDPGEVQRPGCARARPDRHVPTRLGEAGSH